MCIYVFFFLQSSFVFELTFVKVMGKQIFLWSRHPSLVFLGHLCKSTNSIHKAPPSETITLGLGFQCMNSGEHKHLVYSSRLCGRARTQVRQARCPGHTMKGDPHSLGPILTGRPP